MVVILLLHHYTAMESDEGVLTHWTKKAKAQTESLGGSFPHRSPGYTWAGREVCKSQGASSVCFSEVLM